MNGVSVSVSVVVLCTVKLCRYPIMKPRPRHAMMLIIVKCQLMREGQAHKDY